MTKKKIYGVFSTLSLLAVMLLTACADNVVTSDDYRGTDEIPDGTTCFCAEVPEGTRTSMIKDGTFHWSEGDHIFVKDDDGVWQESGDAIISDGRNLAKFYVPGKFGGTSYSVLYTGKENGTTKVEIPKKQTQAYPNDSEHYKDVGDCAVATATKGSDSKFNFILEHQMAYLIFEPRVETTGVENVKLRRITVTELDGKEICGTFGWDEDGSKISETDGIAAVSEGSSEIKLLCGKDVEAIEKGEIPATSLELMKDLLYGFMVKNRDYSVYDGDTYADETPIGRAFMVIRPGTYRFKIVYEFANTGEVEQRAHHKDIYGDGQPVRWTPVTDYYTCSREVTIDPPTEFKKNHYYRIRHSLPVEAPDGEEIRVYNFEEYYMWGAGEWLWDGVAEYPVHYGISQSENEPEEDSDRWFDYNYPVGSVVVGKIGGGTIFYDWQASESSTVKRENKPRHRQAQTGSWGSTLNANQMSFYVFYGDPHYDNVTPWILDSYNGVRTICYGGVWLKKKAAIVRDSGIAWPGDDGGTYGSLSAPFPAKEKIVNAYWEYDAKGNKDKLKDGHLASLEGGRFNLRYCAPPKNMRMPYTNFDYDNLIEHFDKKPWDLDPSKSEDDYFFVPCLGQYNYADPDPNNLGHPTLVLVGGEGFYWTRTPLQYHGGDPKQSDPNAYGRYWYGNPDDNGADNAFYLNIHNKYIALSWEQEGQYVKTGMRKALTSGGTGQVVFE